MSSSFPPDYPQQYQNDNEKGKLLITMHNDQQAFAKAASTKYTQLNFPYSSNYITKINVGKNEMEPLGGTKLEGKHTRDTCAMNAALVYNEINSTSLNTKYVDDIMCKIMRGEQSVFEGLYSSVNNSLLSSVTKTPVATTSVATPTSMTDSYRVQLSGLLMPTDGDRNGRIELTPGYTVTGYKTLGIWIGIRPETCTPTNSVLYYENGVLTNNSKNITSFLILKNTSLPFVIKYKVDSESLIRFYPETDGAKIPFVLKSKTKQIPYTIKTNANKDNRENIVYYNFQPTAGQKNLGKCTIYNSKQMTDTDRNTIENSKNYETQMPKLITSLQLTYNPTDNVEFVGLNETGTLTAYISDASTVLKSSPIKDKKESIIEAKNKGKQGINKTGKYSMVLDDSIKKMQNTRNNFAFPIENLERTELTTNAEWKKTKTHLLQSIDNSEKKIDRGIKMPSMKISKDMPLFSKNYKLKMTVEKNVDDQFYYLRVYGTFKNNNSIVAVFPDFKMGQLFIADENTGVNTMYMVDNKDKTTDRTVNGKLVYSVNDYQNYYPPSSYNNKESEYSVFEKKRDGYCKEQARGKSHFFVIERRNKKPECVVPKNSNKTAMFLPKQLNSSIEKSTLYIPNKSITSGNVKTDKELGVEKYKYLEDAYSARSYTDYKVSASKWTPDLNLSNQNTFFNQTANFGREAVGLKSKDNSKDTAQIMPKGIESFAAYNSTYTDDTINQINNYTLPRLNSYLEKQTRVNQNVVDISGNIKQINAKYADMSSNIIETNGVKNYQFYDFTDEKEVYSLKEDRSLVPALLKDQQIMVVEHNNLFIISTIAITTLLVGAIFATSK